jgi:uncharacterized cupredoxin-like copper-binding protein
MRAFVSAVALLCGAARAADVDWAAAQPVTVQLIDDKFVPDKLTFKRGTAYRLRLRNEGKEMHEFTAAGFIKTLELGNPQVLEESGEEVLVRPGQEKEFLFVPRKPGRYQLDCADHDWDGMVGEITVEP